MVKMKIMSFTINYAKSKQKERKYDEKGLTQELKLRNSKT